MTHVSIPLTQGLVALVSPQDEPIVAGRKWHAKKAGATFYAASGYSRGAVYMHRLIMGVHNQPQGGLVVDHINHNGLDNTRTNLRLATYGQNLRNRRDRKTYTGLPGVTKQGSGWVARITHDNTEIYLGFYPTEREAGIAYAAAEKVVLALFRGPSS